MKLSMLDALRKFWRSAYRTEPCISDASAQRHKTCSFLADSEAEHRHLIVPLGHIKMKWSTGTSAEREERRRVDSTVAIEHIAVAFVNYSSELMLGDAQNFA